MDALKNFLLVPAQERRTLTPNTIKIVIFVALIAAFVLLLPSANGQEFSTPITISNNPGVSHSPEVIVDGQGNINVIWQDTIVSGWGNRDIFFNRSTDGGQSFSSPLNISHNPGDAWWPKMAIDGEGNIFIVWEEGESNRRIYFCRSTDGGQSFSEPFYLSSILLQATEPEMAVDGQGYINIACLNNRYELYFYRSIDTGQTFSGPIMLSNESHEARTPRIAVDSQGKIYVAWNDNVLNTLDFDIFLVCSADGTNFSQPVKVNNFGRARLDWTPGAGTSLIVDTEGKIYIIYFMCASSSDWSLRDIFFSSSDDGINFSTPINVSNSTTPFTYCSSMALDSQGNINIIWDDGDELHSTWTVLFSRSIDGGLNFSPPLVLSEGTGVEGSAQDNRPRLAIDSWGNINVVWHNVAYPYGHGGDIFFSRSTDGISFSYPLNISNNSPSNSGAPAICVDSQGNIYVAWQDDDPGNFDIFISKGTVNRPPVANAGVDQTVVDNTSPLGTEPVTLDGSASYDPDDDDLLSYLWTWAEGSAYGENPTVQFAVGTHIVTLTVTDLGELSDSSHVIITVLECNPTTMIDELITKVQSFNLQNGIENSLDVKLSNARMSMDSVQDGDIQDAINKLQAFIKECEAQRGNKLTAAQADELIEDANTIAGCLLR